MATAIASLLFLLAVIVISCIWQKVNPGILAIMGALVIGSYVEHLKTDSILSNFPIQLFILLVLMSYVFSSAHVNGTLENLTNRAITLIKGRLSLLPILFFILSFALSAMGPGNITAVALLAPISMAMSRKYKLSPLVAAIMICTGANAGAFSPFAPTGVVATGLMKKIGTDESLIWTVFFTAAVLQTLSAVSAYLIFLIRSKQRNGHFNQSFEFNVEIKPLNKKQIITFVLILSLISGVIIFKMPLLLMASLVTAGTMIMGLSDEDKVIKKIPWSVILMVTGIAMLIGLLEKTGGLDLATGFIAKTTSPNLINAVLALITGVVSAFSSSSGVVMPAFIPLIPGLVEKMMLDGAVPLIVAVAVGSHMVDVSPLSTLGALSLAAVEDKKQRQRVFKYLLLWGMSMSVVGAILAFIFLDIAWSLLLV